MVLLYFFSSFISSAPFINNISYNMYNDVPTYRYQVSLVGVQILNFLHVDNMYELNGGGSRRKMHLGLVSFSTLFSL